jgi:hypothetical protein
MHRSNEITAGKTAENLVLEFLERVWHEPHDLGAISELMTVDYTITTAGKTVSGRDAFIQWVGDFQKLLLDSKTDSVDIFSDSAGERVVSRWVCSGKNNGLFGLRPDQENISFTGIAIWTVREGRLASCWVERSAYELYLGLTSGEGERKFV